MANRPPKKAIKKHLKRALRKRKKPRRLPKKVVISLLSKGGIRRKRNRLTVLRLPPLSPNLQMAPRALRRRKKARR